MVISYTCKQIVLIKVAVLSHLCHCQFEGEIEMRDSLPYSHLSDCPGGIF